MNEAYKRLLERHALGQVYYIYLETLWDNETLGPYDWTTVKAKYVELLANSGKRTTIRVYNDDCGGWDVDGLSLGLTEDEEDELETLESERKRPGCLNPAQCGATTTVGDTVECGWGELDENGFWEHYCTACTNRLRKSLTDV